MNVSMVLFGAASAAAAVVTGIATYAAIGDPPEPAGTTAAGARRRIARPGFACCRASPALGSRAGSA